MDGIRFEKCTPENWQQLLNIGKLTFITAFGHLNNPEDMDIYIQQAFSKEKIITELENEDSLFYFGKLGDIVVGYFKLNVNEAQSEPIKNGLEIERIYLLSAYQGLGIGQLMMNKIFDLARKMKLFRLWLGVWNKNVGAVRFYERNGFKKFGEHDFLLGNDLQRDDLMELTLQDD